MKTTAAAAALLLFACLVSAPAALAQQSAAATLSGIVTDPNGARIAGAQVTTTHKTTKVRRETTTNDEGVYAVTNLPPGEYEVKVQASGFADRVYQSSVVLQVGQNVTLDVGLEVAGQSVVINEVGEIPLIDTLSSKVDSVVSERENASLPLNGRNFLELALLVPGNAPAPNFDPTKTNVVAISSAGQLGRGGNITVDGVDNNDDMVGGPLQNISQDAVQVKRNSAWYFGSFEYRNQHGAVLVGERDVASRTITRGFAGAPLNDLLLTLRTDFRPNDVRDNSDTTDPGFLRSSSFGQPVKTASGVFGSGGPRAFQLGARFTF